MSLVNDMLENLARRQARDAAAGAPVLADLRPVPSQRVALALRRAALALALVAAGALPTGLWAQRRGEPDLPRDVAAAPAAPAGLDAIPVPASHAASLPSPPAPRAPEPEESVWLDARHAATLDLLGEPPPAPAPSVSKTQRPPTAAEQATRAHREALAALERGEAETASDLLQGALALDPSHTAARRTLVVLRTRQGALAEARTLAEAGLARDPHQPGLAKLLARVLVEQGAIPEALQQLERSAPPVASDPEHHAFRAALHQRLGQHARAALLYQEALRVERGHGAWWMGLGISLEAEGRRDEARRVYRMARAAGGLAEPASRWVVERLDALEEPS